jgi:hypothetical protein
MSEGDWKVIEVSEVNLGEMIWVTLDQRVWQLKVGEKQ